MALQNRKLDARLQNLSREQLEEYLTIRTRLNDIKLSEEAQAKFLRFVTHVWPDFIEGKHHRVFAQKLQEVADGNSNA